jgi:hypothetical protein
MRMAQILDIEDEDQKKELHENGTDIAEIPLRLRVFLGSAPFLRQSFASTCYVREWQTHTFRGILI